MTTLAEHNRRLKSAGLPTVETLTRRVLAVLSQATAADLESGARWYPAARDLAQGLAARSGRSIEQVAAVISHLSPRTSWDRNIAGATHFLATGGEKMTGIIGANHERALAALNSADPADSFGGPKTLRFYRNIIGDVDAVTVDVWALRVVGIDDAALLNRVGVYDAIEAAYQRAAYRVGLDPSTVQATTWVVARGGRAA